jgi:hypothetical protein
MLVDVLYCEVSLYFYEVCTLEILPAGCTGVLIRTGIDESNSLESRSSLQDRETTRVSDELCHVVEDDGLADEVCSGRDVDHGCGISGRVAHAGTATVAVGNGTVDCVGIIGNTVTYENIRPITELENKVAYPLLRTL